MAAPQVLGTVSTGNGRTSNGTSHTVTLPSGIQNGDWVVIQIAFDGGVTATMPTGWLFLLGNNQGSVSLATFARKCQASESGTTVTVTSSASEQSSFVAYRVTGSAMLLVQNLVSTGSSTNSTFATFNMSNKADIEYLVLGARGGDSTVQVTAPSTNYAEVGKAVGGTGNAAIYVQSRSITGTAYGSELPGALTVGSEQWCTHVIVFATVASGTDIDFAHSSYDGTNSSGQTAVASLELDANGTTAKKLGFKITGGGESLKKVWAHLYNGNTGSPSFVAEIMSVSGGAPNAVLATSTAVNPTLNKMGVMEFTFSTAYELVAGTEYFIMISQTTNEYTFAYTVTDPDQGTDYIQQPGGSYVTTAQTGVIHLLRTAGTFNLSNTENASATDSQTGNMAPVVKSTVKGVDSSATTSRNVTLPSGINAGDIILIWVSTNADVFPSNLNTWRYVSLLTWLSPNASGVYWKYADGTEDGASVTIATTSVKVAWVTMVIGDPNGSKKTRLHTWLRDGWSATTSLGVLPILNGNRAIDGLVLGGYGLQNAVTVSNPSTGWKTEATNQGAGDGVDAGGLFIQSITQIIAAHGEVDPPNLTASASTTGYAHLLAFEFWPTGYAIEPMDGTNTDRIDTFQTWMSQHVLNDTAFGVGQAFRASTSNSIKKVQAFFLKENVAQTAGTITCKIYYATGIIASQTLVPDGSALATSNSVNIADIKVAPNTYTSVQPIEFIFDTPFQINDGTTYVVTFEVSGNGTTYDVYGMDGYSNADLGNKSWHNGTSWAALSEEFQIQLIREVSNINTNTENASATDSSTASVTFNVSNTENASSVDSQTNTRASSHDNTENASATESETVSFLYSVANTENASATESQTATVTSSQTNTDNASATESQTNTRSSSHTNTENASSTDSQVGTRSSSHTNTENASAVDSQTQALTIPVSNTENASATDSQTRALIFNVSNTENAAATESQTATVSSNQSNTENASAVDSQTKALTINVTNTENASASDSQVATAINLVSNTENASASDSQTGIKVTEASNTENASAVDSQTQALTIAGTNTENTSAVDSQVSTQNSSQTNTENASATDSQIGDKGLDVTNTENASATDSQTQALTIPVSNTENASASDSQTGLTVISGENTENASAVESQTREYVGAGSNTENASSVESQIATVVRVADNTENASSVDSTLVTAIHLLTNTESATAIESQLGDTGITGFNTENASATEDEVVTVIYAPTNTENASATDSSTGTISTSKANTENASATDDQSSLIVKLAANTENASSTESQVATVSSAQANTENTVASDSTTVIAQMGVTHTENASVTENNLGALFSPQSFSESASATDTQDAEVSQAINKAIDEAVSLGESILLRVSRVQQRDETETIIEDTLRRLGLMRAVSEVENISEIVTLLKAISLSAPEVEQISELITILRGSKLTTDESEALIESVILSLRKIGYQTELENIVETVNYLKQLNRPSSEIETIGEVLLFAIALKRTSDETINTLESVIATLGYRNGTDEIVSVLESLVLVLTESAPRIWTEVVNLTESVIVKSRGKVDPMSYNKAKDKSSHIKATDKSSSIKAEDTTPVIKSKGSGG